MGRPAVKEAPRTAPQVDLDRISATYSELKRMQVKLDPNPIEFGPKRFNTRIARVRAMLNRVDQIFLQTSEDLHYFQRIINAKQTLYELEKRELMVNDPRCRVGRSQQEREALADVQLRGQIEEIIELKQSTHDLETVMVSIKSKRADLKDAQGRMRDQMKLIEHDLGMGARWGNHAPSANHHEDADQLDDMLKKVDQDLGIEEDEEEEEEEEEETEEVEDEEDAEPEPKLEPEPPKTRRSPKTKVPPTPKDSDESLAGVLDFLDIVEKPVVKTKKVAPREEPVLTFGETEFPKEEREEDAAIDESNLDEDLFGTGDTGSLPPAEHAQETADEFLEELDPDAKTPSTMGPSDDAVGIDELIASFADD
jgi:hypothetical protein